VRTESRSAISLREEPSSCARLMNRIRFTASTARRAAWRLLDHALPFIEPNRLNPDPSLLGLLDDGETAHERPSVFLRLA